MNKIQKFIKDNNLDFSGYGSDLNSNCVILAGYALYLSGDAQDYEKLQNDIEEFELYDLTIDDKIELERVYDYAYYNDYYKYWETAEAHEQYIFE